MNEKKQWQQAAEEVVTALADTGLTFTSNDVWRWPGLPVPPNRRWLGPVVQRLNANGVIRKVGEGVLSEHGHGSRMNSAWTGA